MMRRLGILAGLATMFALVFATGTSATSDSRQVAILDDCEPVSFNLAVGAGTCLKDGTTTFQTFVGLLAAHTPPAAWRFSPTHLKVAPGGTIEGHNRGGEDHTFTEVASFGGGCIEFLNGLLGLTPVAECAGFPGGAFGDTQVPARGTIETAALAPGVHRFECLIHPWMRTTVTVG